MTIDKKRVKNKKVLVAISGGVDSAVAAHLIKEQGFLVTGVYLDFFDNEKNCKKAEEVASKVGVSFTIIKKREEFKKVVINYFIEELEKGRTPNPCVVCNREMKFEILAEELKKKNADFIATGHYARVLQKDKNRSIILKGKDEKKDQSYFLWNIRRELLNSVLFPLGDFRKETVKKIAKKIGVLEKNYMESQEVCFISSMKTFLNEYVKSKEGDIIDKSGNFLGKHQGLAHYTVGQRKGLSLSNGPYYVVKKDVDRNLLIVTCDKEELLQKELSYNKASFFSDIKFPFDADVKIRYNGSVKKARVEKDKVVFKSNVKSVTPGQSVVFYNKEELLGGGVIE